MKPSWLLPILLFFFQAKGIAQTCNTPGQNPSTAFPVCGTSTFIQASVNLCGGRTIVSPKCAPGVLADINPYWYKFTCFEAGTLAFTITPNSPTSDYDWQVYDITGRNADDVFTDATMTIASNWSQYFGNTGTSTTAANLLECEGTVPQFSKRPDLIKGHTYLLLVSHFSNTQAGYRLDFGGGTAIITDTTRPEMKELQVGCGGTQFYLKLNKKMKCSSIAPDGSDWEFFNANVPIASAIGVGCNGGFETDSIIITAVSPVPAGTFALRAKKGNDGNTMLDICDAPLAEGQTLVVNVLPATPALIDSIKRIGCGPQELEVVMKDFIQCNSIAADGSDFIITGPSAISVAGAAQTACANGATKIIKIQLATPINVAGVYTVAIKQGSDGNTLVNQCVKETPAGNSATVIGYDTVSAKIDIVITSSCNADTITYSNAGGNGVNSWLWQATGTSSTGTQPVFRMVHTDAGRHEVTLRVSNGVCNDSWIAATNLTGVRVNADFDFPKFACPDDSVRFTDKSTGPVATWLWILGNGNTSTLKNPPLQFYTSATPLSQVPVTLIVSHPNGCKDTATNRIQVPNNCYIAIPSGFTPNGDGLNDYLYPLNAWKATELYFRVYNRYGQLVWETRDWSRKWDGRLNGQLLESGTYVWMLQYTDESGKKVFTKGTTVLVR